MRISKTFLIFFGIFTLLIFSACGDADVKPTTWHEPSKQGGESVTDTFRTPFKTTFYEAGVPLRITSEFSEDGNSQEGTQLAPLGGDLAGIHDFNIDISFDHTYNEDVYSYLFAMGMYFWANKGQDVNIFSDFSFVDSSLGVADDIISPTEPSCVFGGEFVADAYYLKRGNIWVKVKKRPLKKAKVYPYVAPELRKIGTLFYCETTQDLMKKVKVPSSWISDDNQILLYCNDGEDLSVAQLNFGLNLKSIQNSYKNCIAKNIDTGDSVLYILETGNEQLDFINGRNKGFVSESNIANYFGGELTLQGSPIVTTKSVTGSKEIPIASASCISDNDPIDECYFPNVGRNNPTIKALESQIIAEEMKTLGARETSRGRSSSLPSFLPEGKLPPLENEVGGRSSSSVVNYVKDVKDISAQFIDVKEDVYYLKYSGEDHIIRLSNTNFEEGQSLISSRFNVPGNLGPARVALFRYLGNGRAVYGYDGVIKDQVQGESSTNIRPTYLIKSSGFSLTSFCSKFLRRYDYSSSLSRGDKIACSDSVIKINSAGFDGSDYGKQIGEDGNYAIKSFTLFKNIILQVQ